MPCSFFHWFQIWQMLDCVFVGKETDSTLSSHTYSRSRRAGITPPGPWRSANSDGEQSANALRCRADRWQLCGKWRHADRCGSISLLPLPQLSQAPPLLEWPRQRVGLLGALPISTDLMNNSAPIYPRVQFKAALCELSLIRWSL